MFPGKVHNLRHLGFRHLVGKDAALADTVLVYMHHDLVCRLGVLIEEALEHVNYELHRRVVVIEQQDAIEVRPLGLRLGLGDNGSAWPTRVALAFSVIVRHADDWRA